ncbi:MAG: hypothetical protein ACXVAM_05885 [Vulcanimicrobiaceae bacterium]
MIVRNGSLALVAALALSACASRQPPLPVSIHRCDAVILPHGFTVNATLHSDARKPVSGVRVAVDFYQDFRYSQFVGSAKLAHELDPGQTQDVVLTVAKNGNLKVAGNAMRCYATHIDYLDGTAADLPPQSYGTH